MASIHPRLRWAYLLVGLALASDLHAQRPTPIEQVKPTAIEMSQLPQYCWGSFGFGDPALLRQPAYNINGCGPRMNHFCPALLAMLRASDYSRDREQRRFLARYGEREVQYTLSGIPAECPILPDVKMAEKRAAVLVSLLK